MIIRELHWEFKQRYNKQDSNFKKDFTPMEIDALLWDAILEYVEIFYSGNNSKKYKLGFEVTQQRIDMLSSLVVGQPLQPALTPDTVNNNKYEFYLSQTNGQLVEDYMHLVRAYADTNCGKVGIKIERHNDLSYVLGDAFRKPSKKWKRLVGVIEKSSNPLVESSLYVYSTDDFIIDSINIEYIKCPVRPYFGGYNSIAYNQCVTEGSPNCDTLYYNAANTNPITSDLPAKYHHLIAAIAAQEVSRRLEDANRFSLKQDKIQTIT